MSGILASNASSEEQGAMLNKAKAIPRDMNLELLVFCEE